MIDLAALPRELSGNVGPKFHNRPEILICHYTGGLTAKGAIEWLRSTAAHASAHVVIAPDGGITVLVEFDHVAWHAGASEWTNIHGEKLRGLNAYSWGFEFVNPGPARLVNGKWYAGNKLCPDPYAGMHQHASCHDAHWARYTSEQITAGVNLARALGGIKEVIGHDDVAPDRKIDPGPAFPMAAFRAQVLAP